MIEYWESVANFENYFSKPNKLINFLSKTEYLLHQIFDRDES